MSFNIEILEIKNDTYNLQRFIYDYFFKCFRKNHVDIITLILLILIGIPRNILGDIQKKKYDLDVPNLI